MNISLPHMQKGSKRGSLPMTYVPKSTKLILEAKQQLQNDVVQHSFIISYNIQYTHILDELTSYIMGRKDFSSFLKIICCCIHGLQLV